MKRQDLIENFFNKYSALRDTQREDGMASHDVWKLHEKIVEHITIEENDMIENVVAEIASANKGSFEDFCSNEENLKWIKSYNVKIPKVIIESHIKSNTGNNEKQQSKPQPQPQQKENEVKKKKGNVPSWMKESEVKETTISDTLKKKLEEKGFKVDSNKKVEKKKPTEKQNKKQKPQPKPKENEVKKKTSKKETNQDVIYNIVELLVKEGIVVRSQDVKKNVRDGMLDEEKEILKENAKLTKELSEALNELEQTENTLEEKENKVSELEEKLFKLQDDFAKLSSAYTELESSALQEKTSVAQEDNEDSFDWEEHINDAPQVLQNLADILSEKKGYLGKTFAKRITSTNVFKEAIKDCHCSVITFLKENLEAYVKDYRRPTTKQKENMPFGFVTDMQKLQTCHEVEVEEKEVKKKDKKSSENNISFEDIIKQAKERAKSKEENKEVTKKKSKSESESKTKSKSKKIVKKSDKQKLDNSDISELENVESGDNWKYISSYTKDGGGFAKRSPQSRQVGWSQFKRGVYGIVPTNEQLQQMVEHMSSKYVSQEDAMEYIAECWARGQNSQAINKKVLSA